MSMVILNDDRSNYLMQDSLWNLLPLSFEIKMNTINFSIKPNFYLSNYTGKLSSNTKTGFYAIFSAEKRNLLSVFNAHNTW